MSILFATSKRSKYWLKWGALALATLLWCALARPLSAFDGDRSRIPLSPSVEIAKTWPGETAYLLAAATADTDKRESSWLEAGRQAYRARAYRRSLQLWEQGRQLARRRNDRLQEALFSSNLALAYQQLGQWEDAASAIARSLEVLAELPPSADRVRVLAQTLNNQGNLLVMQGQTERAFLVLQNAERAYAEIGDDTGQLRSQLNQALVLQRQGQSRQALAYLSAANRRLQSQPDSAMKAAGLRYLGNVLARVGNLANARQVLETSLAVAEAIDSPGNASATALSLGNLAIAENNIEFALASYQQAADRAQSSTVELQALVNQFQLSIQERRWRLSARLYHRIRRRLQELPANRTTIYAQINFAKSLLRLERLRVEDPAGQFIEPMAAMPEIGEFLASAVRDARTIGDTRAESYALGNLGGLYESDGAGEEALRLTREALLLAQASNAPDISYQWQWQLGRLLRREGRTEEAIAAYREAVKTLRAIRSDLVALNREIRFSFRDEVEPVYRQAIEILLDDAAERRERRQERLREVREIVESLQVAELVNFFQTDCEVNELVRIDEVDPQAAVLYPLILSDRVAVLASLPGRPLSYYTTPVPEEEVENVLQSFQLALLSFTSDRYASAASAVYNWIIRPLEADLEATETQTLVFISDGWLRNLPMSALYDGEQFLVEKYAIALTPGLQLIDPKPLARQELKAAIGGLTEARQGFDALPAVKQEIERISTQIGGTVLVDRQFTNEALERTVQGLPVPVVHLATHGQFSSNAEETFILTWDDRIDVNELGELLQRSQRQRRQAIELLVLSACETATGDDRATLGLAGVAVRAGARSTLATLWAVSDEGTAVLMSEFYEQLKAPEVKKSEALRQAQQALIEDPQFHHPFFWAPFVLVGNWL